MRPVAPNDPLLLSCIALSVAFCAPIGCGAGGEGELEPWSFSGDRTERTADAAPDTSRAGPPVADTGPAPDARGSGPPDDVCVLTYEDSTLSIEWSADDDLVGWLDGESISESNRWTDVSELGTSVLENGRHVLTVLARDRAESITGFIARVDTGESVDEPVPQCGSTGADSKWRVTTDPPADGWREVGFDDSDWQSPTPADSDCVSTWNDVVDVPGAKWVWQSNCKVDEEGWNERNWYRLEFEFRPAR